MRVNQQRVSMPVSMGFAGGVERGVTMVMMRVVFVLMLVLHFRMGVVVQMRLLQMQKNPEGHERGRQGQSQGQRFGEKGHRNQGAYEGRRGEIGGGARRTEEAQRPHEQYQAHAIAEEAHAKGTERL